MLPPSAECPPCATGPRGLGRCELRISSARAALQTHIAVAEADLVLGLVRVLADGSHDPVQLLAFIQAQLESQGSGASLGVDTAAPGYADEMARKTAVFALGLLSTRADVADAVTEALTHGQSWVHIQLDAGTVRVRVDMAILPSRTWQLAISESRGLSPLH